MDVSISAGRFKGKKLKFSDSQSDFRPTKLMVREAICSSVMVDIVDSDVLELCGGSGVFSLELMSRGANSATVVELDKDRSRMISRFAGELGISDEISVRQGDVAEVLPTLKCRYHIIFFDPPYYTDNLADLIPEALGLLAFGGILIFEHASDDKYIDSVQIPSGYKEKKKKYGQTTVRYYRNKE